MAEHSENKNTKTPQSAEKPDADTRSGTKRKAEKDANDVSSKQPKLMTAANLTAIPRKKRAPEEAARAKPPPRRRSPTPEAIRRSPTPPDRSPPRQRKRPGAAARVNAHDLEAVRQRQSAREQEENNRAKAEAQARGVHDIVKQHYNAVPERGRDFRKNYSVIKGLRCFNNWVKSVLIQKFSPDELHAPGSRQAGLRIKSGKGLCVLDIGMGKGGDLIKWQRAPQPVDLYVGVDPADVSISQARDRYREMQNKQEKERWRSHGRTQKLFQGEFLVKDGYGEWLGTVPIIQEVGIDPNVGPGAGTRRLGGGGFDVVTMMFCMHYAFENEEKARGMLKNVAGSLKRGGRFIGVIPNSDVLTAKVKEHNAQLVNGVAKEQESDDWDPEAPSTIQPPAIDDEEDDWDPEKPSEPKNEADQIPPTLNNESAKSESDVKATLEWGNSIYRVKFPGKVPADGVFKPPFGWKYFFFLEEAVETVPEYVVPWEAFRAMAADYDLELQYRKTFQEVWQTEKDDPIFGSLSERMGVREENTGRTLVSEEEFEAANFYHAFCFYKV